MEQFSPVIINNPLFEGVPEDKLEQVIDCMNGSVKAYEGRTLLFCSGDQVPCLGLVLEGCVEIFLSTSEGNAALISQSGPGELFGQAMAVAGISDHAFEIYALEGTKILFLYVPEFTSMKNCGCTHRFQVMENLMKLVATENMSLMAKIRILTQGTLRKKLLLYFSVLSKEQRSRTVRLPFGRDKLAFYLCSDRSAVSRELGRMKKDGLISYTRNEITLLTDAPLSL